MIKRLTALEALSVNELVSRAFGYISPHSFFDDFPIWDLRNHQSDAVSSFGIEINGTLVAHVGARIAEIKTHLGKTRVGLIGAVATDTLHRAKGHSSALLKHAIAHLESQSCEWMILWGSEHEFYGKLGFSLMGTQARGLLKDVLSRDSLTSTLSAVTKSGMNEAIFQSLQNTKTGVSLSELDRNWVMAHRTVQWFSTENPFSFIGYGRGMDMGHIIHEFGGDPSSVKTLLQHLSLSDPFAQIMGTEESLLQLGFERDELILENLCLAKPSNKNQNAKWNEAFWISGLGAC